MHKSIKRLGMMAGALVAATALLSLSAASAGAAVPAKWVNPGEILVTGSLTLKVNGANEKTCTVQNNTSGTTFNLGSEGALWYGNPGMPFGGSSRAELICTGNTRLALETTALTKYETNYYIETLEGGPLLTSPYGGYWNTTWKATFTNGAPSTMTLSNTKIGSSESGSITASGTLTIKRSSGANITLTK